MKTFVKFTFILIAILVAGCKNKTALNDKGIPQTLVIANYAGENPGEVKKLKEPIRLYLQKKLGMPVEMLYTTDYTAVIEAMRSKKAHIAELSPFSYILLSQDHNVTPLVTLGNNGKPYRYRSVLIVSGNSSIKTIDDLKKNAKNLSMCFSDPASTSGHLIPRAYLTSIGLNPDYAFKQILFSGGHLASVLSVKAGKVDAGATMDLVMTIMLSRGMIKKNDIRVLWSSDSIVSEPIVVRNNVNKLLAKRIKDAFLSMGHDDHAALKPYLAALKLDGKLSYMPVADSSYNSLRKIARNVKDLKLNN